MSSKKVNSKVAGLDRVSSGAVRKKINDSGQTDEDYFDFEDLEIWSLLPDDVVSLIDSDLDLLSIGIPKK